MMHLVMGYDGINPAQCGLIYLHFVLCHGFGDSAIAGSGDRRSFNRDGISNNCGTNNPKITE